MSKSLYEFNNDKKNSILSDLVSVIIGFNDFPLNMYKTLSNTCINIKILQIQCKYIIQ